MQSFVNWAGEAVDCNKNDSKYVKPTPALQNSCYTAAILRTIRQTGKGAPTPTEAGRRLPPCAPRLYRGLQFALLLIEVEGLEF